MLAAGKVPVAAAVPARAQAPAGLQGALALQGLALQATQAPAVVPRQQREPEPAQAPEERAPEQVLAAMLEPGVPQLVERVPVLATPVRVLARVAQAVRAAAPKLRVLPLQRGWPTERPAPSLPP